MRKVLALLVAAVALAGCGGKVSDSTTGTDCVGEYKYQRQLLRNRITEFQSRMNAAMASGTDPTNVKTMLVADYENVKAEITAGLDQIALKCGATGACAEEVSAWVAYEKQWLRGISLLLAGAEASPVQGGEPAVTCS